MRLVVVGSGVSGAHAALTLLERQYSVELWDVGREEPSFPLKGATFQDLKESLEDPVSYFLGEDLSALIPPESGELLRYPPSRRFLTSKEDPLWEFESESFFPFVSHAKGGLAAGWGSNALSYDDNDLTDWPISFRDMEPAYKTVYGRIPVAGAEEDDLSRHFSGVYPSQSPVKLSNADQGLLQTYNKKKAALSKSGICIGLARLAVVTDPEKEEACDYCNRCLWGCPRQSIYNPAISTLRACQDYKNFKYVPERFVLSLLSRDDRITGIRYLNTGDQQIREESCDAVFLAAGALQTGGIFLRTLKAARPELCIETDGLMDTRVVKLAFVAMKNIGRPPDRRGFQFNRLNMGVVKESGSWPRYLHGELLHLNSLMYHPLIESLPLDSRFSKKLFFTLKSALGVVTLFFPDKITSDNRQALGEHRGRWEKTQLHYAETEDKKAYIRRSIAGVRAALWRLGCIPRGVVSSPLGAGIHYAGTVPMGKGPKRCDADGRSNLFPNLYLADGAAFPSLPSKSITMSLAAHATRVATNANL